MNSYIRLLKLFSLLGAAGLTAFLFLWTEEEDTRVVIEAPEINTEGLNRRTSTSTEMLGPRFLGEDSKNRRWEVTAHKAIQKQQGDIESVWLEKLSAYATMENGEKLTFEAGTGVFDRTDNQMRLDGDVRVEGFGYVLETSSLTGNLQTRYMTSDTVVTIRGVIGEIKGGQMEAVNNGNIIKLAGGVQAKLWPNRVKQQSKVE